MNGNVAIAFVRSKQHLAYSKKGYPSRPEVQVLENINLIIPHRKTTALVGARRSGKSTIVGLAEMVWPC